MQGDLRMDKALRRRRQRPRRGRGRHRVKEDEVALRGCLFLLFVVAMALGMYFLLNLLGFAST
ncbi:RING-type domain-containing protein [Psidium guajava]|nr:RING-type domain-containing protein [Psidium guajava]